MIRFGILVLSAVAMLSACGKSNDKRIYFDGAYFRTKAKAAGDDRAVFNVDVKNASQSLNAARQAGEYEATRYCIKNFGSSRIDWIAGPNQPDAVLLTGKDSLLMQGECKI